MSPDHHRVAQLRVVLIDPGERPPHRRWLGLDRAKLFAKMLDVVSIRFGQVGVFKESFTFGILSAESWDRLRKLSQPVQDVDEAPTTGQRCDELRPVS